MVNASAKYIDYVEMQWLMLQQNTPEDFVIATGIQYSVREFIEIAAQALKMNIEWKGSGLNEVGIYNNKEVIKIDERYFRPTEVETLLGDASKAHEKLGWKPKISFQNLVEEMVEEDYKISKRNELIRNSGYSILDYYE